jgi:hypothetical protein
MSRTFHVSRHALLGAHDFKASPGPAVVLTMIVGAKKLRNGTFIIPSTGERSRRQFTLRRTLDGSVDGPAHDLADDDDDDSENEQLPPLISRAGISSRIQILWAEMQALTLRFWAWLQSPAGHGVLKCTLAYTLASLATFLPFLSNFLGKPDGKHVVATITVYFHPARTAGSMIEAVMVAVAAIAYAEVISIASMMVSVFLGSTLGFVQLAHAVVLVVFIGGGFGFIGWTKQRLNNEVVNVACSLASLAIIGVVTKETAVVNHVFSNQKIVQVSKMLVMGVCNTTAVNLLVWRVSARDLLRDAASEASVGLGDMLALISRAFLSGSEDDLMSDEFLKASNAYAKVYPRMLKYLREAKFEHYFLGREKTYVLDRAVVKSIETLAQSIGGLRSAAKAQFALLKEPLVDASEADVGRAVTRAPPLFKLSSSSMLRSGLDRGAVLAAIDEAPSEEHEAAQQNDIGPTDRGPNTDGPSGQNSTPKKILQTPSEIFELFMSLQGPSMKSLAYTLSEVLREPPFGRPPNYAIAVNDRFRQSLTDALSLFNNARADALHELYKQTELNENRSEKLQADYEEVAAACGHFSFSLQAFGEEMKKYLDVLDDLRHTSGTQRRSWNWILFWKKRQRGAPSTILPYEDAEREALIDTDISSMAPVRPISKTAQLRGLPESMLQRRDSRGWDIADRSSTLTARVSRWLLRTARKMARDDIRFGIKVGFGATLWAMFAFIPQTRDFYSHFRGEWGLLSYMVVCAMTTGASNTTGWARFVGTIMAACLSYINWNVSHGNAVALIVLGWFVAFYCFWLITAAGRGPLGRIALLAYNVSVLYAYSLSQKVDDDDEDEGGTHPIIGEIVLHRFTAVTAGIMWGLIVCRLIWPISARRKFKEGLAVLYLQMGLIWRRGPLATLLRSDCSQSYLRTGEQAALQRYASQLEALRHSATSEFELRGPFPFIVAGKMMRCTDRILDAFYAMSLVTERRSNRLTEGEKALLVWTARERSYLCERICHVFQVLASSMMLEYPLANAIPSVIRARDRLLGRIFEFRQGHVPDDLLEGPADDGANKPTPALGDGEENEESTADGKGKSNQRGNGKPRANGNGALVIRPRTRSSDVVPMGTSSTAVVEEKDYALLYAYTLVTGQVAEELKAVAEEIEGLFGVLDENAMLLQ